METQPNPYQSTRLTYRALDKEDDEAFVHALESDPIGFINSELAISRPQSKQDTKKYLETVLENNILAVVVCVTEQQGEFPAGTPIGIVSLTNLPADQAHHRNTEMGLQLLPAHQGKGYGTEAIEWALEWAFDSANMHRVAVKAFEYNPGAMRLYERLGFKLEGVIREMFWHNGRWWADYEYGMLASEWRAKRQAAS